MSEPMRLCPICLGADQHQKGCVLEGKPHVYVSPSEINWPATLEKNKWAALSASVERSEQAFRVLGAAFAQAAAAVATMLAEVERAAKRAQRKRRAKGKRS